MGAALVISGASTLACQQINDSANSEISAELWKIEQKTITSGDFRGILIGQIKQQSLSQLQKLGIDVVIPRVRDQIVVRNSDSVHLLTNAEGIIWFPGYVRIDFSEDQVRARSVGKNLPLDLKSRLNAANSREEVLKIFADVLDANPKAEIGNYAPGSHWIKLRELSRADWHLLTKYDAWEFNYHDEQGFWHLRLEFAADNLSKIVVQHSLVELP